MAPSTGSASCVLWQGFRHRWQYNHRVKRIGSYVEHLPHSDRSCDAQVVHTAASGTGPDRADITELFTKVSARGVSFQSGVSEIQVRTVEDELADFNTRLEVTLDSELVNKTDYTVVLNGFDLYTDRDADKLMTLVLEVTDPQRDASSPTLVFNIKGAFRVDCSSAECDRIALKMREQRAFAWPDSIYMLDRKLMATPEELEVQHSPTAEEPVIVERTAGPPNREVLYRLRVHYLIVAGDSESLCITPSKLIEHPPYMWNCSKEIFSHITGRRPLLTADMVTGDTAQDYGGSTLAFKQIVMSLYRDDKRILWPWQQGSAMHLLEWNIAISEIEAYRPGIFTCTLELFFKNWRRGMKWAHLWQSLFAYKDAGEAQFGAQLVLLQFKDADLCQESSQKGSMFWPGGDEPADNHPAAMHITPINIG